MTAARTAVLLLALGTAARAPLAGQERPGEVIWYMTGAPEAVEHLRIRAPLIDVVGPQVYGADAAGRVTGGVDPRILEIARAHGIRVMPLIHNPGFDQAMIHALLADTMAQRRVIAAMVRDGVAHEYWGWQFDFENIPSSDRDAFTRFYRAAAGALQAEGMTLSVAVVPWDGVAGDRPFQRYMTENWRGVFDLPALAAAGDFISLMTYAQHGTATAPGPVAGLGWMRRMVEYALAAGVPPGKLSLGVPAYSAHWWAGHDVRRGPGARGREVHWTNARSLLDTAGVTLTWAEDLGASYAFFERAGTLEWLFVEDARAFAAKLDLFHRFPGLRGISVWVLGAEDPAVWTQLRR